MTHTRSARDVSANYCAGCGAALTPGSQFCAYCGRPIAAGPGSGAPAAAPLPASGPMPPPYPPAPGMGMEPVPPRRRPRRWVVVLVVVIIVVAIVGGLLLYESEQVVDVNVFIVWSPNNVCGLGEPDNQAIYSGLNDSPGNTDYIQFYVPNYNTTQCVISDVTTNTSGFTAVASGLPLIIPGNDTNPGGVLNVNLTLTGSPWTGNVNLVFT